MRLNNLLKPGTRTSWLLGETLVVVLGVLIALGLNDFWMDRQDQILEVQYLKRLKEDVQADFEISSRFVDTVWARKMQALDAIAPIVRGEEPVPDDIEAFLINVSLGGLGGAASTSWVTNTTFADLKSSANLRLIRDAELRRKIGRYYIEAERLFARGQARKTGYVVFVHSILPAELRDDISLAEIEKFGVDRAVDRLTSPEFQDLLNQEYNYAFFRLRNSISGDADKLVSELDDYIRLIDAGS